MNNKNSVKLEYTAMKLSKININSEIYKTSDFYKCIIRYKHKSQDQKLTTNDDIRKLKFINNFKKVRIGKNSRKLQKISQNNNSDLSTKYTNS